MTQLLEKDARFWDKIADKYNKRPVGDEETYQHKLRLTQAFLTSEMDVLEFGCGTGSTAILHAPHVKSIRAIDVADNMLKHGRTKAAQAGVTNITFEVASIEVLPEDGSKYDVILGLNILHLCRNPRAVTQKVRRMLKPGGLFVQSTACLKNMGPLARVFIPMMQVIGKAPYVNFMSSRELRQILDSEGFHIVEKHTPDNSVTDFLIARRAVD